MKTRLVLASVMAATAALAAAGVRLSGVAGPGSVGVLTAADQTVADDPGWTSEHRYIERENFARAAGVDFTKASPSTYLPSPFRQVPLPAASKDAVTVLAVGDSVTMGHGLFDLDTRWPDLLQRVLDNQYGTGVFRVDTLAMDGVSVFEQARWLNEGTFDFDALVMAVVRNDILPGLGTHTVDGVEIPPLMREQACREEQSVCEEKYPDMVSEEDVFNDPSSYPLWLQFRRAAAAIATAANGRPWLVLSAVTPTLRPIPAEFLQAFSDEGATVVVAAHTAKASSRDDVDPLEFRTIPSDAHPGPVMTYAYALDVAAALGEAVPPDVLARARSAAQGAARENRPLVSNYLPTAMDVGR